MDLRLLEQFVSVAEEGSIRSGARRLMIAQPAVSKGLQRLERQVGTALLLRSPHGIELTPAGKLLLDEARDILDRIGRVMHAVRDTGQRERKITIGLLAGAVAAAELTEDIVRTYRRQHPGLTVSLRELTFPDQFSAVADGEVDVAIVRPPCSHDELEVSVLFDEPLVLCCSAYHELADAEEIRVEDILDEPMLDMTSAPRTWTDFWHLRKFRGGPARTATDPVSTLSELQLAVSFGSVVTPVAASAWRIGLASSSLSAIPMRDAPRSQVAVATRHKEGRADVADFLDCARQISGACLDRVPGAAAHTG